MDVADDAASSDERYLRGSSTDGAPGMHAAIITPELFERVLEFERFDPFTLRGLLACGTCGKLMSRQSARR